MTARRRKREGFTAATWNTFHGTPLGDLEKVLQRLLERDQVDVILLQEAQQTGLGTLMRGHDLGYFKAQPETAVAWRKDRFTRLDVEDLALARTRFLMGGGYRHLIRGASVILGDPRGRTVEALSYHLPAGVQRSGSPNEAARDRMAALRESMQILRKRAATSCTTAVLFGGDDNVDERHGRPGGWDFMRRSATGLRLVQAPDATHAGGRRIDDFRVEGLRVGVGRVRPGGGDHKVHVRRFIWKQQP